MVPPRTPMLALAETGDVSGVFLVTTLTFFGARRSRLAEVFGPIALDSDQWVKDYNEIKELGEKNSSKRSARQTEDARFWLMTGPRSTHPLDRQIAIQKEMSVIDSARFMAVIAAAEADSMIAVFDAKYKYGFWRPVTAIRNGDIDGNAATERQATWQPIDNTPMHPEYPCAHCIVSSAGASAIEAMLGTADIPEVAMTSWTRPSTMLQHSIWISTEPAKIFIVPSCLRPHVP